MRNTNILDSYNGSNEPEVPFNTRALTSQLNASEGEKYTPLNILDIYTGSGEIEPQAPFECIETMIINTVIKDGDEPDNRSTYSSQKIEDEIAAAIDPENLPKASTTKYGVVKISSGLSVNDGVIAVMKATSNSYGIVKAGTGVTINDNGELILSKATAQAIGGIIIGSGLTIDENGVADVYLADGSRLHFDANNHLVVDSEIDDNADSDDTGSTLSAKKIYELTSAAFSVQFVQELPETGDSHTLYFVPAARTGATQNVWDEYMWDETNEKWEQIGDTFVDVSNFYTKDEVNTLLAGKQDKLTAGTNITIDSANTISAKDTTYSAGTNIQIDSANTISATDTTYSAGNGIDIDSANTISVDESEVDIKDLADSTDLRNTWSGKQDALSAGTNITISGTTISAKDTTYSAGANIQIDSANTISATDTTYTAGENVEIDENNVISAKGGIEPINISNNGFYFADGNDNIGFYIDSEGGHGYKLTTDSASTVEAYSANKTQTEINAVQSQVASKQDVLTAGSNIEINNNVISSTAGIQPIQVAQEGFYIIDENDNIGFYIDSTGWHGFPSVS